MFMYDAQSFIDKYLLWLKQNMIATNLNNGTVEITSPLLDRHNDYIQIYVTPCNEGGFLLSDDGYTISDLTISGMEFNTEKRKMALNTILNSLGIQRNNRNELFVKSSINDFPLKKHNLMQAILAVNDLFVLSQPNIKSFFLQDVEQFLAENDVRFSKDIQFTGKSGYTHKYDFLISKSKAQPERLIKVVNDINRTYTDSILFSWLDIREIRSNDTVLYAFVNDISKQIPHNSIDALREYQVKPVLWTDRERYRAELAA